jgi:hypothetical protein
MSDQDFFFEDEQEVIEKPKKTKGGAAAKKAPAKTAPKKSAKASPVDSAAFTFSSIVVVLIAIIALLIGFLVGILLGKSLTPPVQIAPTTSTGASPMGGVGTDEGTIAPELDDSQMEEGTLPAGHPDINGTGSDETSATE